MLSDEDAKRLLRVIDQALGDLRDTEDRLGKALPRFDDGFDIMRPTAEKLCKREPKLSKSYSDLTAAIGTAKAQVAAARKALDALRAAAK